MNSRDRVRGALARTSIDRIPRYDSPWEDTIARWKTEGLPVDANVPEYFDFDIVLVGIDVSMRCPMKLISDEGEYRTVQDRYGYTVRHIVGKSRTVECLEHVTTDKDRWQDLKGGFRFDPSDTARIDRASVNRERADRLQQRQAAAWVGHGPGVR